MSIYSLMVKVDQSKIIWLLLLLPLSPFHCLSSGYVMASCVHRETLLFFVTCLFRAYHRPMFICLGSDSMVLSHCDKVFLGSLAVRRGFGVTAAAAQ